MLNIASLIDHTVLKPTTTLADVRKICEEARQYKFAAVCVPPPFVRNAYAYLENADSKVATVIGFPFGYSSSKAKMAEVRQAIEDRADELDVVINLIALKSNAWNYLASEVSQIAKICHSEGRLVKVIIESGILSNEEIIKCCEMISEAGADFAKTSTGYAEKGATVEAVSLMRKHLHSDTRIKASGGIKTFVFAKELVEAGADRLGCSSSVAIVKDEQESSTSTY